MNDKILYDNLSKEYFLCLCCEKMFEKPHGKPHDFDHHKFCVGKKCLDCGEVRGNGWVREYNDPKSGEFRVTYDCCLECNPTIRKFQFVCGGCFDKEKRKWKKKVKKESEKINQMRREVKENYNRSKLIKENQELKQQLVEIQQELTIVLGKPKQAQQNNSRLEQELIQIKEENQELITNKNIPVDKVEEQIRKSQFLLKEANASIENINFSPQNEDNKISSSLPYVIGGSAIISLILTFGYYLLRKNKEK